jgi:hypothetical protein
MKLSIQQVVPAYEWAEIVGRRMESGVPIALLPGMVHQLVREIIERKLVTVEVVSHPHNYTMEVRASVIMGQEVGLTYAVPDILDPSSHRYP